MSLSRLSSVDSCRPPSQRRLLGYLVVIRSLSRCSSDCCGLAGELLRLDLFRCRVLPGAASREASHVTAHSPRLASGYSMVYLR